MKLGAVYSLNFFSYFSSNSLNCDNISPRVKPSLQLQPLTDVSESNYRLHQTELA